MITASILLSVALTVQPDAGLRLVNPHPIVVDAKLTCADGPRELQLDPYAVVDLAVGSCTAPTLESTLPLLALETKGETEQRLISELSCLAVTMSAPLFACEKGVATASVPLYDGATYAWTAEGGTIAGSANTNRVTVNLGEAASVKLSCVVTRGPCSPTATGVIAIRKPLLIHELNVPQQADTAQPLTINWSYTGDAAPAAQLLTGDAFPQAVTLPGDQRSYTFTPTTSGTRNVELTASYATSIQPPAAPKGRRRSAGTTFATATQCPSARAAKQIELRGCALETPEINAPADVESGSTFTASVDVLPGDGVIWDVKGGGTLLTSNSLPQIEVRAEEFGAAVDLTVRVLRSEDCESQSGYQVTVHPRASCTTDPPSASLSVLSKDCYKATIQAVFTGTPPFTGRWSDGTEFQTSASAITHDVPIPPGQTGITNFRDSICSGFANQVTVEDPKPDAILTTVGGNCMNSKIVATLIGTPPFKGLWNDGETFITNEHTVEKTTFPHYGRYWIHALEDAVCWAPARESYVEIGWSPRLVMQTEPFCQYGPNEGSGVYLEMTVYDGTPPYTVYWSDGEITTSNYPTFGRIFTERESTTVEIVRATTGSCDADVPNPVATIIYRPRPQFDFSETSTLACMGKSGKAALAEPLPGATLEWSITNGTITSGQGTPSVTYEAGLLPMTLTVTASYPDGLCSTSASHGIVVDPNFGEIMDLKATPATIAPGGTTLLSYRLFGGVRWYSISVDPSTRDDDLKHALMSCTPQNVCTVPFTDSKGAGTANIGFYYGGDCIPDGSVFTSVTITP